MPMDPPSRKKKHGPPCQWTPPLERRNMPPPSDFFTKSHMNCPFLPSFLSVTLCPSASGIQPISQLQLHVILYILEDIIVEHFTVLTFFLAGLGPQISACFAQVKVP